MLTKCLKWVRERTVRGDEYYRAVTRWATSRRTDGLLKNLLSLGSLYEKSLDRALVCLRKLKRSEPVEKEIRRTENYKAILVDELTLLQKFED